MASSDILLSLHNGVRKIQFNTPKRKNAISKSMYATLTQVLNNDANNDDIVVTIITGTGDYYTSGNDFKAAMENPQANSVKSVEDFVNALINYPKIIIAVVNGPAIGIGATTLTLCDVVYASDRAWFETPFLKLGLCAEGCSSYNFPRILGKSKASEMLLLGKRITAEEAYHFNLISEVIPHEKIDKFIESLYNYGNLPVQGVKVTKNLMQYNIKSILSEANKVELKTLSERLESEDFGNAIIAMMNKKSKL